MHRFGLSKVSFTRLGKAILKIKQTNTNYSFRHPTQTDSEIHTASCSTDNGGSYPEDKAAGA
jgi:hypothetical protein